MSKNSTKLLLEISYPVIHLIRKQKQEHVTTCKDCKIPVNVNDKEVSAGCEIYEDYTNEISLLESLQKDVFHELKEMR